ncbi:PREDICTED: ras suppressor protein 1-like [Hipposideros armiger]|uniref:Ras suppressor protein 1-like n=1 Tax=Hipposideros armiger TaxID=186990 RepID=A0A8B7QF25_HIPAR|nr:PREDICTED: ras suppressor protein 1-like [Hipposideros armiger]
MSTPYYAKPGDNSEEAALGLACVVSISVICNSRLLYGNLDLTGQKQVFKAENNPWVTPIADQFQLGVSHVFEYIRSETYKYLYGRHMQANPEPPKKNNDKSKKISRKPLTAKNK